MKGLFCKILGLFIVALCVASCGNVPNPAAPPSPPAELPTATYLEFPSDVSIEGRTEDTLSGFNASGLSDPIDGVFQLFSYFSVPVSSETTNHEEGFVNPTVNGYQMSGTFHIKIDFSDLDLDNDGTNEGCSGHTASTPICFRMWMTPDMGEGPPSPQDYRRMMAGIFEVLPTATTQGKGQVIVHMPTIYDLVLSPEEKEEIPVDISNMYFKASYDFQDEEYKSFEDFSHYDDITVYAYDGNGNVTDSWLTTMTGHYLITQAGPDGSATKTEKWALSTYDNSASPIESRSIEQWKEQTPGYSSYSDSYVIQGGVYAGTYTLYTNDCVIRSSIFELVDSQICSGLGILAGTDFLATSEPADAYLPNDFTELPSF